MQKVIFITLCLRLNMQKSGLHHHAQSTAFSICGPLARVVTRPPDLSSLILIEPHCTSIQSQKTFECREGHLYALCEPADRLNGAQLLLPLEPEVVLLVCKLLLFIFLFRAVWNEPGCIETKREILQGPLSTSPHNARPGICS